MALKMNKYGGLILPPGVNDLPPGAQRRLLEDMVRRLREQETHEEEPAEAQPAPPPEPEPPEPSLPPRSARKPARDSTNLMGWFAFLVIVAGLLTAVALGVTAQPQKVATYSPPPAQIQPAPNTTTPSPVPAPSPSGPVPAPTPAPTPPLPEPQPTPAQPGQEQPAAVDWDELAKRVAPYVFRIQSSDGTAIGTAFYTGDNWRAVKEAEKTGWAGSGSSITWIYTAAHIVRGHENCEFEFQRVWKGKVEREWAEAYKEDANPDFTALSTKWDGRGFLEHSPEEYFENAPLFGDGYALAPGDIVLIVGNPRNLWQWDPRSPGPIATLGKVLAVDVATRIDDGSLLGALHKHLLKLEADTDPGSSGSPVFNSKGQVVGMVIAESTERVPKADLNRHVIWAVMFPLRK